MSPRFGTSSLWRFPLGQPRTGRWSGTRRRRDRRRLAAEQLEPRALLAVSAGVTGSELLIDLSEAGDTAALRVEGGSLAVRDGARAVGSFSAAGINSIRVVGRAELPNQSLLVQPGGVLAAGLSVNAGVESTSLAAPLVTTGSVTIDSASITLGADVRTAGRQAYAGTVRVAADIVIDAGASEVRFGGPIRSTVGLRASLMDDLGAPYRIALSPGSNTLYATDAVSNFVYFIDLAAEELDTVDLGKSVGNVLLNQDGSRLYVANPLDDSISVLNTGTRGVLATIPVVGTPEGMAMSADGQTLFVANYSADSVALASTSTNRVTRTISVAGSPTAVTAGADGRLWVASESLNQVSVYSLSPDTLIGQIDVGRGPADIALSPDGTRAYVANNFDNTVSVIDTSSLAVIATLAVGSGPTELAVSPNGRLVYVVNGFSDNVSVIDTASLSMATTVPVGSLPVGVAISADSKTAYVANLSSLSELGNDARSLTVRTTGLARFDAPPSTVDPLRELVVEASQEIESAGQVTLAIDPQGNLRANGTLITAGGGPVNFNNYRSWGWTARAAEVVGLVPLLAWENEAGAIQIWELNSNWAQVRSIGTFMPGSPEFFQAELDFGIDFNGDGTIGRGLTVVENTGSITLAYDSAGNLFANETAITSFGRPVNYHTYLSWGWTARAAETIRGVNTIAWQNGTGAVQLWELSAGWSHQNSRGDFPIGSAAFNAVEASFSMDFDGDGKVAPATTVIEGRGATTLEYDGEGNLRANGILITSLGSPVNYDTLRSWGWTARAAERVGGVNTIVWQNDAGALHFWRLSTDWVHESSEGNFLPGSPQYDTAEAIFGVDIDGDGRITIESAGSWTLWYDQTGNLQANHRLVTSFGAPVNYDLYRSWGWEALAAEILPNVGRTIVWRNVETGGLHYWRLGLAWAHTFSEGDDRPGSPGYNQAERDFRTDFDRNGIVGESFGGDPIGIESRGSVVFMRDGSGNLLANGALVQSAGRPVSYFTYLSWGWTAVAADVVGGVNTIAWRNTAGDLHLWELTSDWVHVGSRGNYAPGSSAFESARQALELDL